MSNFFGENEFQHGNIMKLMEEWMAARDDPDAFFVHGVKFTSVIAQMFHDATLECSSEVRAALHAMGHVEEAVNVCRCWLTSLPDTRKPIDELPKDEDGDPIIPGIVVMGVKVHSQQAVGTDFRPRLDAAIVAVMRAKGIAASWNQDGTLAVDGPMDHFHEHLEAETQKFADEIEKELGGDKDPENPGERKWWS